MRENAVVLSRLVRSLLLSSALPAVLSAQTTDRLPVEAVHRNAQTRVEPPRPQTNGAYDWPQLNFGSRHSGNNVKESIVSSDNVASLTATK